MRTMRARHTVSCGVTLPRKPVTTIRPKILSGKRHNFMDFEGRIINTRMINRIEQRDNAYIISTDDHPEFPSHYTAYPEQSPNLYAYAKKIFDNANKNRGYVKLGRFAIKISKISYIQAEPDMFYVGIRGAGYSTIAAIRTVDPALYREIENLYLDLQEY